MMSGIDILLIEDEPNIAEAVRFILMREGWRLEIWTEGGQALDRIRALRPRLVILDVMLPAQSGLEVLAALRADPELASTQVLMLTARGGASLGGATRLGKGDAMAGAGLFDAPEPACTDAAPDAAHPAPDRGTPAARPDFVMAKPFDNDELRRVVKEMLGQPA